MLQKVVSYRNRAEVCRQMAHDFLDESRKRVLESIADDYERMAAEIEKILKAQSAKPT
jgi:DNA-binding cell septation regulator SpoVG